MQNLTKNVLLLNLFIFIGSTAFAGPTVLGGVSFTKDGELAMLTQKGVATQSEYGYDFKKKQSRSVYAAGRFSGIYSDHGNGFIWYHYDYTSKSGWQFNDTEFNSCKETPNCQLLNTRVESNKSHEYKGFIETTKTSNNKRWNFSVKLKKLKTLFTEEGLSADNQQEIYDNNILPNMYLEEHYLEVCVDNVKCTKINGRELLAQIKESEFPNMSLDDLGYYHYGREFNYFEILNTFKVGNTIWFVVSNGYKAQYVSMYSVKI